VAVDPPGDLKLAPLHGEPRALTDWLTTFHLVVVVLDPFTYESAWILDTAGRLLTDYTGADCRVGFLVTGDDEEARQFLGPWASRLLTFADPERELVKALDLQRLPALVHIDLDCHVAGVAEGWHPLEWRAVFAGLSRVMSWTRPAVPAPGDPAPFDGSPALG
jgi:hypothetical protein